jgi:N-acetylmuramic acid 6-phosphate (MurNAc-6-P) etherase
MILELKVSDSMEGLEDSARDAIDQIHRKNYYLGMKGDVILVGLAFCGKVPFGVTEVISV